MFCFLMSRQRFCIFPSFANHQDIITGGAFENMIRLNVFIQVSESNRAAVLEAAKELVASSLNDKGCIAYDIFESATRNDVLMICVL